MSHGPIHLHMSASRDIDKELHTIAP